MRDCTALHIAWTTLNGEETMFDNLDEQIAKAEATNSTQAQRVIRYLMIAVVSVLVFGGLFLGVWLLEY
jgi:hypothetical protein